MLYIYTKQNFTFPFRRKNRRSSGVNSLKRKGIFSLLVFLGLALATPAFARTQLEIEYETPALQNQELSSGAVKVLVDYTPFDAEQEDNNLRYRIFYNGVEKIKEGASTLYSAEVFLQDLDNNNIPEVVVRTYSGGAHCCTSFQIYSWQNERFINTEIDFLDGSGGEFKDLDGNGTVEFLTSDNAFLYQFSSYAGSFPPSLILNYDNGIFVNVTEQYPSELKSRAWRMYQAFLERNQENYEINGILAGYVAQKILLGEYQQGWNFMLTHYDPTSAWGLEIYHGDREVGKHPNFPTALQAFLIEHGYLN